MCIQVCKRKLGIKSLMHGKDIARKDPSDKERNDN